MQHFEPDCQQIKSGERLPQQGRARVLSGGTFPREYLLQDRADPQQERHDPQQGGLCSQHISDILQLIELGEASPVHPSQLSCHKTQQRGTTLMRINERLLQPGTV